MLFFLYPALVNAIQHCVQAMLRCVFPQLSQTLGGGEHMLGLSCFQLARVQ
jgi:hypothetical protein